MALRVAFDLDGVLADFESAYRAAEERVLGTFRTEVPRPEARAVAEEAEDEAGAAARTQAAERDRQARSISGRERIWREIQATPDFWATLHPLDRAAIPRLHSLAVSFRWEVVFVTQRPHTAGETVQRQTQRWLREHGYELPSVLVLRGSRGKVADALHLDFLVDDSPQNCIDIVAESNAKAILVLPSAENGDTRAERARQLGIGVVPSISSALDFLEEVENARANPGLLQKLAKKVGLAGILGLPSHRT